MCVAVAPLFRKCGQATVLKICAPSLSGFGFGVGSSVSQLSPSLVAQEMNRLYAADSRRNRNFGTGRMRCVRVCVRTVSCRIMLLHSVRPPLIALLPVHCFKALAGVCLGGLGRFLEA